VPVNPVRAARSETRYCPLGRKRDTPGSRSAASSIPPPARFPSRKRWAHAETRIQGWEVAKPVVIEDNVWSGGGAILLPGVSIGRNAVVGAGFD
jgi:acetyltransferase-like isoleucine patch superfamily enzyme